MELIQHSFPCRRVGGSMSGANSAFIPLLAVSVRVGGSMGGADSAFIPL